MRIILMMACVFAAIASHGQSITRTPLYQEGFDSGSREWSHVTIDDLGYEAYINQGKYVCRLPENNSMGWAWTFVSLPDRIRQTVDSNSKIDLEFDWTVTSNRDDSRIGLMFDTYNIRDGCPGGDFRAILFEGDGATLETSFSQTMNCNRDLKWIIDGTDTEDRPTNHVKISKDNYTWTVYVNGKNVLDFNYSGSMRLAQLNYGRGTYLVDNISIYRKNLSVAPVASANQQGATTSSSNPRIWILLAGIDNYLYQTPLNYTVNDVRAMYNFWTSASGGRIPRNQIVLLENQEATVDNILRNANRLFSQASQNDIIITFLSGHGGYGSFASHDGTLDYQNLNVIINRSNARKKLCIIDACHSGSFSRKEVLTSRGETLDPDQSVNLFYAALSRSGDGIAYLLACRANQLSVESPELQHGLFTYYFLEGLNGAADTDRDNLITIQEIYSYLARRVPAYEATQNPELQGTYDPTMPLAVIHK
ncbi:caspase family protein [Hymenobacter rigui]|nr:caspase family protein [Hymenobacter rigui]